MFSSGGSRVTKIDKKQKQSDWDGANGTKLNKKNKHEVKKQRDKKREQNEDNN